MNEQSQPTGSVSPLERQLRRLEHRLDESQTRFFTGIHAMFTRLTKIEEKLYNLELGTRWTIPIERIPDAARPETPGPGPGKCC